MFNLFISSEIGDGVTFGNLRQIQQNNLLYIKLNLKVMLCTGVSILVNIWNISMDHNIHWKCANVLVQHVLLEVATGQTGSAHS